MFSGGAASREVLVFSIMSTHDPSSHQQIWSKPWIMRLPLPMISAAHINPSTVDICIKAGELSFIRS
jgi:hypothetical protein